MIIRKELISDINAISDVTIAAFKTLAISQNIFQPRLFFMDSDNAI